jgi:putative flippase GtrA
MAETVNVGGPCNGISLAERYSPVETKTHFWERPARSEVTLALRHAGASGVGFVVDLLILHLAIGSGLEPAWARAASLACAVNMTFLANGLFVFRCLESGRRLVRQWLTYLATNTFGNLCNYWIFVALVSLHHQPLSGVNLALCVASFSAWIVNYGAARLIVFAAGPRRHEPPAAAPSPDEPEPSRR